MTTEATPDQQREVLEALFQKLNPPNVWHEGSDFAWKIARFTTMLDAGAFVDAALMLVDDETFWRIGHDGEGADPSQFRADLLKPMSGGKFSGYADTPALALCAAIESIAR